ncbi:unnamed protein product [Sphagnum troendelagicum]|uniref:RuvB-like helicase n=1 Tax=Sphagnum troendelagicum TaxID=128251 RepID=A0ABP0TUE0_9BRYO
MVKALSEETPFAMMMAGSEIFYLEINKTERLSVRLSGKILELESKKGQRFEGEVVEIQIKRPATTGAASKTGKLTLKTTEMETVYDLGLKSQGFLAVFAGDTPV